MMNQRLINANELLELYEGTEDRGLRVPVEVVVQNIKDMPTAYEPDKVIKKLRISAYMVDGEYEPYDVINLDDACKIVKKGGAV